MRRVLGLIACHAATSPACVSIRTRQSSRPSHLSPARRGVDLCVSLSPTMGTGRLRLMRSSTAQHADQVRALPVPDGFLNSERVNDSLSHVIISRPFIRLLTSVHLSTRRRFKAPYGSNENGRLLGTRDFAVFSAVDWNSLQCPPALPEVASLTSATFVRQLKAWLFGL